MQCDASRLQLGVLCSVSALLCHTLLLCGAEREGPKRSNTTGHLLSSALVQHLCPSLLDSICVHAQLCSTFLRVHTPLATQHSTYPSSTRRSPHPSPGTSGTPPSSSRASAVAGFEGGR